MKSLYVLFTPFSCSILELFILGPPHKDNTFRCMVNAATVGLDDQIPIKHPQLTAVGQDFIKAW